MGCRPLARVTSARQRHDSLAFVPLMGWLAIARRGQGGPWTRPGRVLGDKAYSSTAIRAHLRLRGIKATIPDNLTRPVTAAAWQQGLPPACNRPRRLHRFVFLLGVSDGEDLFGEPTP